jgi:DNA-binding NtrC family response regulator
MKIDTADTLILIVGGEKQECQNIVKLINQKKYSGIVLKSISALEKALSKEKCMAILIDIDTVPVENRELRELTLKYPESSFLCMSHDKYHPELKEAICYHIYACINKPVNYDELFFLLRSIRDDNQ